MIDVTIFGRIVHEWSVSHSPVRPEWRFVLQPSEGERTITCVADGVLGYSLATSGEKATHALVQCTGIRTGALHAEYATAVQMYTYDARGFARFSLLGTVKRTGISESGRASALLDVQCPPVLSPGTHEVFIIPRLDLSQWVGRTIWATGEKVWIAKRFSGDVPIVCFEASDCVMLDTREIAMTKVTPQGEALCRTR